MKIIHMFAFCAVFCISLLHTDETHAQTPLDEVVLKSVLRQVQVNLKIQLPRRVDSITTFENVTHQDKTLIFEYKIHKSYSSQQENDFQVAGKKLVTNWSCREMVEILRMGGVIRAIYRDAENNLFATVSVERSDCSF